MLKKYIVRLSDEERKLCRHLIDKPRLHHPSGDEQRLF